jgi:hypothetical protein
MKKYILTTAVLLVSVVFSFAQDCKAYFPMKKGVTFEITNYNDKGKEEGKAIHKITNYSESGGDVTVDVTTEIVPDKKSEEPIFFDYQAKCEKGNFTMNKFGGVSSEQMGMMNGMVTIDGDYLGVPNNPSEGQTLPDAQMTLNIGESDSTEAFMKFKYIITNRKVEGYEKVETAAGNFEALKISYDVTTKMVITMQSKVAEWFVEGVGVVKTEQYNKKGKRQSYSLLTSLEGI